MAFSASDRSAVCDRMLAIARADARVTAAAFVGSLATDAMDAWSDLDITCGIRDGEILSAVLDDWVALLDAEYGVVHHFDVTSGAAIYRVVLFANRLELDISVSPASAFGARGPQFKIAFERAASPATQYTASQTPTNEMIGWVWHHVLHANASIARGRPWQAEFWISGARDYLFSLRCLRAGVPYMHGRGIHRLPAEETSDMHATLVHSLETTELQRALGAIATSYLRELNAQPIEAETRADLQRIVRELLLEL